MSDIKKRALELYQAPFKYDQRGGGYIWDAKNQMVADDAGDGVAARVRGWGLIQYMDNAEELQDAVGEHIAKALTEYWQKYGGQRLDLHSCEEHGGIGFVSDCVKCKAGGDRKAAQALVQEGQKLGLYDNGGE